MTRASRAPIDPRLLRHARSGRTGIGVSALIGVGQAAATVLLAVALARIVAAGFAGGSAFPGGSVMLLAGAFVLRAVLTWAEQVLNEASDRF